MLGLTLGHYALTGKNGIYGETNAGDMRVVKAFALPELVVLAVLSALQQLGGRAALHK